MLAFVRKLSSYFHQSNEQQSPLRIIGHQGNHFLFSFYLFFFFRMSTRVCFITNFDTIITRLGGGWRKIWLVHKTSSFVRAVSRWFASNFLESRGKIYERARWKIESVHSERWKNRSIDRLTAANKLQGSCLDSSCSWYSW